MYACEACPRQRHSVELRRRRSGSGSEDDKLWGENSTPKQSRTAPVHSQELLDLDPVHSLELETLARRLLTSIPSREDCTRLKLCLC